MKLVFLKLKCMKKAVIKDQSNEVAIRFKELCSKLLNNKKIRVSDIDTFPDFLKSQFRRKDGQMAAIRQKRDQKYKDKSSQR